MPEKTEIKNSETILPFGKRLQVAREMLSLTQQEAASQLRLNEQFIAMLESEEFPANLPPTYIYGYIRVYGKLLNFPEAEILAAINDLKSKLNDLEEIPTLPPLSSEPLAIGKYLIRFIASFFVCMAVGIGGMWWFKHDVAKETVAQNNLPTPHIMYAENNNFGIPLLTMDSNKMTTIVTKPEMDSLDPPKKSSKMIMASKTKIKKTPINTEDEEYVDDPENFTLNSKSIE